jgi:drug/metabolite transporter (DMT)-like permease
MAALPEGTHAVPDSREHTTRPPLLMVGLCLAAIYIVWGTTYLAIRIGLQELRPFFMLGTRLVVAGGGFLLVLKIFGTPLPTRKQWLNATLLGTLMLVIGIGCVSVAEQWVSSGAAVALISINPLCTALWQVAFGRKPTALEWAAILIGAIGTIVMVMGQDFQASLVGTAIILVGVGCWTLGTTLANKLEMPHGGMGFAAEMLCAGLVALVVSAAFGEHWTVPHTMNVWTAWAYLVVFGSLIAFSAYRYVVDRVSATLAATYAYANPPVALFVGWWLGGEHFAVNTFIGLPIVLIAIALHAWAWRLSTNVRTQTPLQPAARTE